MAFAAASPIHSPSGVSIPTVAAPITPREVIAIPSVPKRPTNPITPVLVAAIDASAALLLVAS